MILWYVLSITAICSAQDVTELVGGREEAKTQNVEALMRQVGQMGMLLENYRRVILSGITEAADVCGFIEKLSEIDDDKEPDDDMAIRVYKIFFQKLDDPILKSQLFSVLENHIDNCFNTGPANQLLEKRDKSQIQKVRFHSWGGKRNRGAPKVVIRTPFHAWGGKRSGKSA